MSLADSDACESAASVERFFEILRGLGPDTPSESGVRPFRARAGQLLYDQFDPLSHVFIINGGLIGCYVESSEARKITLMQKAFSITGELELEAGLDVYATSAYALSAVEALSISIERWSEYRANERFAAIVRSSIAHRSVRQSLYSHFLGLPNAVRLGVVLREIHDELAGLPTHRELSDLTAIPQKSISRALRELTTSGQLEIAKDGSYRTELEDRWDTEFPTGLVHRISIT